MEYDADDDISVITVDAGDIAAANVISDLGTNSRLVNFCFTKNNFTEKDKAYIKVLSDQCKWVIYGEEKGAEGTPHLQGYVKLNVKKAFNSIKKCLPGFHIEKAKGNDEQNYKYCIKEGNVTELGERPRFFANNGEREKIRWEEQMALAKKGKFDEMNQQVLFTSYHNAKAIAKDNLVMPPDAGGLTGIWICGPAGCGKSRKARDEYPNAYLKMCNKWWDGYQNQENVIIDDFDKAHSVLGHHLKIWGDRYSFLAEVKGGAFAIRPKLIIVTSQYRIEDIWLDAETQEALNRRFKVVDMFPPASNIHPMFIPHTAPVFATPVTVKQVFTVPPELRRQTASNPEVTPEVVDMVNLEGPIIDVIPVSQIHDYP